MDSELERQLSAAAHLDSEGVFAEGIANSAIAGKCGNGGGLGYLVEEWNEGPVAELSAADDLLRSRKQS